MRLHTTVADNEPRRPDSRTRAKGLLRFLVAAAVLLVAAGAITYARAAMSTAPAGQKTWYWQNPLPQGNTLYGVDMVGSNAWAVGGPGIVLHSTDDGAQWEAQDPQMLEILRGVDFVDEQTGWIVGDRYGGTGNGSIKKTADGGSTWTTQTSGVARILRGVSMATSDTGWAVGDNGTIRKTIDGGSNWLAAVSGTTTALYGVSAPDATHAWAVGATGVLIATSDGSAWSAQSSPTTQTLNAVDFVNTQVGYAVGNVRTTPAPARGTVLKTTNGGSTWTTLTVTYLSSTGVPTSLATNMRSVSFRDANTGWISGDTGLVLFTNDGGATWTSQKSGAQTIYMVAAGEGAKGQLVGANGLMLRTTTNGQSWLGQQQGTTVRLNGASWTGPTAGIVVGAGGLVMTTQDAGDSWANRTLGPNDLYGVKFAGPTDGWIVGSGGFIRKTTDAGASWVPQVSGTAQILYSVTAVTTQTAWAVGAAGTILKTVDGGATWTPKTSGTASALYDVFFLDATTGWAVGASGTVRKTVDGGETWTARTSGVTSSIYSVHFTDANNGWYTSTAGRLRRTTDGGTTWVAQTTGTTLALYSVEMADANVGWAVGGAATGSVVLRTVNGGATWTLQNAGFTGTLRQVTVATTSVAGIVGDAGAMRRTFDSGATWESTGFWSIATYRDLSFPDSLEGWAVGDGGVVAHTHDGGFQWGAQQSGVTSNLYGVDFVSDDKGWAVGAGGVIRTTVSHTTWAGQVSGTTSNLWGVDFADVNTGWAVGAAGTILRTNNGGSTWTTQTSDVPPTTILYGVSAVDTRTAFAWGAAGTVAKTIDGGSTWTTRTISPSILYGGAFVDSQTGWVAGASGVLFKTADGGATWVPQTANAGTTALRSVSFVDSSTAYLVGDAGIVRKTMDGGTNWTTQLPGTSLALYSVAFTDKDHGWLVGAGGAILRTTDNAPPATALIVDPPAPNGNAGWFIGQPQISFVANEPGLTYYSWDSAVGPWQTYSVPIVPPHDGEQTIYWYSIDPGGNKETVNSMTGKVDATVPSTPGTPTAVPVATDGVALSWSGSTDAASGVDYYEVLVAGSPAATTTATNVTVSGLSTETAYAFTVRAYDVAGNFSSESGTATAITLAEFPRPPVAVFASAFGNYGVLVNWSESTGTVPPASYRVWRSASGAAFSAVATVTGGIVTHSDTTAPSGVVLRYGISTVDSRGEGAMSAPAAMSTTTSTVLPAPAGLRVTNTNSVLVTWTPVPNADAYHVYRSVTSTSAPETRTAAPVATASFTDTTTPYTEYWYRVAAVDTSGVVGLLSAPAYIRTEGTSTVAAPHGAYSTDSDMCALCHSTHAATSPLVLLRGTDTIDAPLCFSCHDGTAAPDVLGEYLDASRTSRHPVPVGATPGTMQCSDCHGVHSAEQTATVKGLLLAGDKKSGNAYCYECHGVSPGTVPRGDLRGFEQSAHGTAVPEPASGTKVVCLSCHVSHTSSQPSLYPYAADDRCMNCHSAGGLAGGRTNIAARLSGPDASTRHDLRSADTSANGSRLSCGNCHEPHSSTATTPCVDPDKPTTAGAMASGVALCLRCHDDALPSSVDTSGWVAAPLAAGGATSTLNVKASWESTSVHGNGASVSPNLRTDMGYSAGDALTCAHCHDSHGSVNRFSLLESVRSKSGTSSVDSLLVFPMPSGGADLRFFCASCHELSPASHPGPGAGGADLTVWPLDCTASGCHNHAGNGL